MNKRADAPFGVVAGDARQSAVNHMDDARQW